MTPIAAEVVKTTAGSSIATGMWTLVAVVVTTIGGIALAVIKQWGPWKKAATDERAADFDRLRGEIKDQNVRMEKLETAVESARKDAATASAHAARSDAKLQTALTACELLLGLVEREMPGAAEIKLVKRLLAQAASNDMGIGDGMRRIAALHSEKPTG